MINKLKAVIDESRIKTNVSLAEYTTFRTGGNADVFITPQNTDELKNVVKLFYEMKQPYRILGNGSNILVSDNGVIIPVIHLGKEMSQIGVFENCITAAAGATLSAVARKALENSLTGLEFASGIPGTVGGGVIMNAGAYGGEMKDVIEAVKFIDASGEEHVAANDEMEFSYRHSVLSDTDCIITGVSMVLENGKREEISAKMAELAQKRRDKQPLEFPSAGSTFKRPQGYFAAALIEEAGLKGISVGGACVSEKHSGFIINKGGATTADICNLIELVREKVYAKHGVNLECEVKFWLDE